MTTRIDEIAPDTYRISTYDPGGAPGGICFNQFLIDDDEPVLSPPTRPTDWRPENASR